MALKYAVVELEETDQDTSGDQAPISGEFQRNWRP